MKLFHKTLFYTAYAVMIPLLPLLMTCRVLFFKIVDTWFALRGWAVRADRARPR